LRNSEAEEPFLIILPQDKKIKTSSSYMKFYRRSSYYAKSGLDEDKNG
jgi:hypothetical protein